MLVLAKSLKSIWFTTALIVLKKLSIFMIAAHILLNIMSVRCSTSSSEYTY